MKTIKLKTTFWKNENALKRTMDLLEILTLFTIVLQFANLIFFNKLIIIMTFVVQAPIALLILTYNKHKKETTK